MTQAATQPYSDLTESPLHEMPLSLSKILAASAGSSSPISTPRASISLLATWTGMLSNLSLRTSRILICCCLSGVRYLPSLMADLLFGYTTVCPALRNGTVVQNTSLGLYSADQSPGTNSNLLSLPPPTALE